MKNLKNWYYPASVDEALEVLAEGGGLVRPIGGGTALAESRDTAITGLMDVTRISELRRIARVEDAIVLGAAVTLRELMCAKVFSPVIQRILVEAAASVSHRMHRNSITVGGNVVALCAWSDLPVALATLDAEYEIRSATSSPRWISAMALVEEHPSRVLTGTDLLTRVRIPGRPASSGGWFSKFCRTESDYALATAASLVVLDGHQQVSTCRIVVGGVVPRPVRLPELEQELAGKAADEAAIEKVALRVSDHVHPVSDFRAGVAFRTELCQVLVKRALLAALEQARAEQGGQGPGRMA